MNSKIIRSLTVLSFTALTSVFGAEFGASDVKIQKEEAFTLREKAQLVKEELSFLSPVDPFPSKIVDPVDPISGKKFKKVAVGPAFKTRAYGSGYDYYRYVTYYDVSYRKERFYELPIQRAQCYEKSEIFGNFTSSQVFTATVTASASLEGLGLSASITRSASFSTGHGIVAPGGVVADFVPNILFHDWEGKTFVQLYSTKTGLTRFLTQETKESAWWVFILFPNFAKQEYPMPFEIKGADRTFSVDREIVETCESRFGV